MAIPTAFREILLNGASLTVTGANLYLDGIAITGGGGGGTNIFSGNLANAMYITGNQTVSGRKIFLSDVGTSQSFIVSGLGTNVKLFEVQDTFVTLRHFNGTTFISTETSEINDSNGSATLDYDAKYLLKNGAAIVDWDTFKLATGSSASHVTLNWSGRQLSGNWQTNTVPTLPNHLINLSYFQNNSPANVVHTTGNEIISGTKIFRTDSSSFVVSGTNTVKFLEISENDLTIRYEDGNTFLSTQGMVIYDSNSVRLLGLSSRGLYNSAGNTTVDFNNSILTTGTFASPQTTLNWNTRVLSGDWSTDTSPTANNHLVNLGYLTNTLNTRSDLVRTTGAQSIYDSKTFVVGSSDAFIISGSGAGYKNVEVNNSYQLNLTTANGYNYFTTSVNLPRFLDSSSNIVFNVSSRTLAGRDGATAINFADYTLNTGGSNITVNWSGRQLSGDWSTNTNPTLPHHLINLAYFQANATGAAGTGSSSITIANSLFVSKSGNNSTAIRGRFDKHYLTPESAKAAAVSGDLIRVYPGEYAVSGPLAKNGVNWYFEPGANVTFTEYSETGIWDDLNTPMVFTVGGYGNFYRNHVAGADEDYIMTAIKVRHTGSNVTIDCRDVITDFALEEAESQTVVVDGGVLHLNARNIVGSGSFGDGQADAIWWRGGEGHITADKIMGEFYSVYSDVDSTPSGDFYVNANEIIGLVYTAGSNANAALWVRSSTIKGECAGFGAEKMYVTSQKIFGKLNPQGGLFYIDSDKVSAVRNGTENNPSLYLANDQSTNADARITVKHWDPAGFTGNMFKIQAGKHQIRGGDLVLPSGARGIQISGGTGRFDSFRIDTTAAFNHPIVKASGVLVLNSCQLVSRSTVASISGNNGQLVKIQLPCSATSNVYTGITLAPNAGFTVDSSVI